MILQVPLHNILSKNNTMSLLKLTNASVSLHFCEVSENYDENNGNSDYTMYLQLHCFPKLTKKSFSAQTFCCSVFTAI